MSYPLFESLEQRRLLSFTIPGTGITIPDIPGIDLPNSSDASVNDVVKKNRAASGVPGLVAAVIKDGKLDEMAAAGVREAGKSDRVRWGDPMLIASGSKAMTSTLAARLVERGYMKWKSKIVDVFPKLAGRVRDTYLNVTLEQLLSHRGALREDLSTELNVSVALSGDGFEARQNNLRSMLRMKAVAAPGTFSYSNVGYVVAGAMMEATMKEPYENMMRRLVFEPLGMTSAAFGWPVGNAPRAHDVTGRPQSPSAIFRIPAAYNPSGGVSVNIIDWAKFVGVQLGQSPRRFLTQASIEKIRTPVEGEGTRYGLGWYQIKAGPVTLIQHDGTEGFWFSTVLANPRNGRAVLVMTNQGGLAGGRAVHQTLNDLQSRIY